MWLRCLVPKLTRGQNDPELGQRHTPDCKSHKQFIYCREGQTTEAGSHTRTETQPSLEGHSASLHWERGTWAEVLRGGLGDHKGFLELEEKSQKSF